MTMKSTFRGIVIIDIYFIFVITKYNIFQRFGNHQWLSSGVFLNHVTDSCHVNSGKGF